VIDSFKLEDYVVNNYTKKYYTNFFSWCGDIENLKLLLKDGIDYSLFEGEFQNPLQNAVRNNKIEAVRLLLDRGFPADYKNNEGDTSLMFAVHLGFEDIVKLLLERGANPREKVIKNREVITPYLIAVIRKRIGILNLLTKREVFESQTS